MISCLEHGDRAIGSDVATKLANALSLTGEERQRFLFAAAATRRKDRLVGYARALAPEILNFVPKVLAAQGIDLEHIETAELRQSLNTESPHVLRSLKAACVRVGQAITGIDTGDFLVMDSDGKKYVCALVIVPTT